MRISDWSSDVCSSDLGARRDADCVLEGVPLAVSVVEDGPHAVRVHRMGHHSLVDELESHALAVLQADRLGLRVLLVIDGPEIALHVAGQADLDLDRKSTRLTSSP